MRGTLVLCTIVVVGTGCTERDPTYCDDTIPCGPGYRCNPTTNTCEPADAGTDVSVEDASIDKQVSDSGPDLRPQTDLHGPVEQGPDGPHCGDGIKNGTDECDKTDLGGQSCSSLGYAAGTLVCKQDCTLDKSGCLSWTAVPSPTTENLKSVWGTSASDVWAVGNNSTVLRFNGNSWGNGPAVPGSPDLKQVWGTSGVQPQVWTHSSTKVFKLESTSWVEKLDKPNAFLLGAWAGSTTNAIIVGTALFQYDGQTWTEQPLCPDCYAEGVWGTSPTNLWIYGIVLERRGDAKLLVLHNDGSGWQDVTPTTTTVAIYGMWGTSVQDMWAVGFDGEILRYTGLWSIFPSPTKKHLYDVWGAATDDIWAVGDAGTILHFNGTAWVPVPSPTSQKLTAVWGSSASDVWAVGDAGTILRLN
jgi:hypothetical protein